MAWLKLTIECPASHVDELSLLFEQFEAIVVSSEACSDEKLFGGVQEEPVYWKRTAVSALLDADIDLDILIACVRNRIGSDNVLANKIESLADENWLEAHKQQHGIMVFAERLCIQPSWLTSSEQYPYTLVLDPGLAFGTGKHATTRLCLDWLAHHEMSFNTLTDYGCGSGILALAAARLGVEKVYAIDIDAQAIRATLSNAELNQLGDRLICTDTDSDLIPASDCLIANILLNPLIELAPRFAELVKQNGKLVLSGILATQAEECLAVYSEWFTMKAPVFEDEWALLEGLRQ